VRAQARALGLLWAPSVGPGYDDSKIRPWNAAAVRDRGERGEGEPGRALRRLPQGPWGPRFQQGLWGPSAPLLPQKPR
jgi:hypothetical protein